MATASGVAQQPDSHEGRERVLRGPGTRSRPVVANAIPSAHVEGPFISDQAGARGVHDPSAVRPLDPEEVFRWLLAGPVGIITVSPHGEHAPGQVRRLKSLGVTVAVGHTHASPEEVSAAVDAGATLSTHLGNGIPKTLPRHPNIIWRQLADDRLSVGLIADGHHLPFDTLEVMLRAKGVDRAFLVSDATEIGGRPPGRYSTAVGSLVELGETSAWRRWAATCSQAPRPRCWTVCALW